MISKLHRIQREHMEILQQLGANQSAIIQFFIFAVSIAFLTVFVFNPFFKAYDIRLEKTKGVESVAKDTIEETKNLNLIFQSKARESNDKIRNIYDTERSVAQKKSEEIIKDAKADADKILTSSRTEISAQVSQSKSQVASLSQEIATQLTQKFEGGL
jgi:F0F1-type ATP synthase membrane subunit b/b'